jgi:hypothetical protein
VESGAKVIVEGPLGKLRAYPEGTQSVVVTTGGSVGNDIDLGIIECPAGTTFSDAPACKTIGTSGGGTDEESVTFVPQAGQVYAVRVDGYEVKGAGAFVSTETIRFTTERGSVSITGASPLYTVNYTFSPEALASSKLATSELFTSGKYQIIGTLTLNTADGTALTSIPLRIAKE